MDDCDASYFPGFPPPSARSLSRSVRVVGPRSYVPYRYLATSALLASSAPDPR